MSTYEAQTHCHWCRCQVPGPSGIPQTADLDSQRRLDFCTRTTDARKQHVNPDSIELSWLDPGCREPSMTSGSSETNGATGWSEREFGHLGLLHLANALRLSLICHQTEGSSFTMYITSYDFLDSIAPFKFCSDSVATLACCHLPDGYPNGRSGTPSKVSTAFTPPHIPYVSNANS